MDDYARHGKIWRILYALCHRWICRKFALEHRDLDIEGPVLLIPVHSCAWDPLLVAMSLPRKQVYFVASEHLFRLGPVSRLLNWLVAPIPRRKASSGADTVKACLRQLRSGHSVCLFAEGEQCWDGRSQPVFPATGKLARASGATLVTFKIEGGYLSCPRWGKGVRRGRTRGYPVGIYSPEELKAMTPSEIDACIDRDLREDAWERQRQDPVRFRGRRRAEGLEQLLYLCPACGKISTLGTKGDRIFCSCGLDLRYEETGALSPVGAGSAAPFPDPGQWADWQREQLRRRVFPEGEPLFSDEGLILRKLCQGHREEELGRGRLEQWQDRLVCAGRVFPLTEISDMAAVLSSRLLLSCGDAYYEILGKRGTNMLKYLQIWRQRQEG